MVPWWSWSRTHGRYDISWKSSGNEDLPFRSADARSICRISKSSYRRGVIISRGGAGSGVCLVILSSLKITKSIANSHRVALQCDVTKHSLTDTFPSQPPILQNTCDT
ncbi:hypothetical protein TNCV_1733071 [Trichonephila clavipes]|nr:hypothetical protein TNCV_1733071 [Trichonephila clavipes]